MSQVEIEAREDIVDDIVAASKHHNQWMTAIRKLLGDEGKPGIKFKVKDGNVKTADKIYVSLMRARARCRAEAEDSKWYIKIVRRGTDIWAYRIPKEAR
jgi:hypothetical protein